MSIDESVDKTLKELKDRLETLKRIKDEFFDIKFQGISFWNTGEDTDLVGDIYGHFLYVQLLPINKQDTSIPYLSVRRLVNREKTQSMGIVPLEAVVVNADGIGAYLSNVQRSILDDERRIQDIEYPIVAQEDHKQDQSSKHIRFSQLGETLEFVNARIDKAITVDLAKIKSARTSLLKQYAAARRQYRLEKYIRLPFKIMRSVIYKSK